MKTTTTSKATATTIETIAADLGCTRKQAVSRLTALGYVETCGRCGGTGRYSFNTMDGDRCFGCAGSKRRLVRLTAKIAREAKARIEAGELDGYFARCRAIAEARAAVAPIGAEITAMWKGSAVSRAYTHASCRVRNGENGVLIWTVTESSHDVQRALTAPRTRLAWLPWPRVTATAPRFLRRLAVALRATTGRATWSTRPTGSPPTWRSRTETVRRRSVSASPWCKRTSRTIRQRYPTSASCPCAS